MSNVQNKVVLITGASRGIGAQLAQDLAAAGAKVIVNYAGNKAAAENVINNIRQLGGEAIAVQGDVRKPEDVKRMFDAAIDQYGQVDVLINNAGTSIIKPIKETTDEEFDQMIDINIKGTFNTLREAATRLADHGSVINVATSVTRLMLAGYAVYGATKVAVEQFTRVFSREVGARGINVNTVSPGPTNTELFLNGKSDELVKRLAGLNPFNRLGETVDISRAITFLISDEAKWINAQNIGVNGGMA